MRASRPHREDPRIMDAPRFDAIARRLSQARSRRAVLGLALAMAFSWSQGTAAPRPGLGERCKPKAGCAAGSCINRTCVCGAGQRRCGSTCIANGQCCNADGERRCGNSCISGSTCCTDDGERRCGNGCTKPGECCHADGERQCSDGRCIAGDRYCSARECPPIGNGDPCIEVVLNQQGGCATRDAAAGTPCGNDDIMSCDGAGTCVAAACTSASQCPGRDGECKRRRCRNRRCEWVFDAHGTPLAQQMAGDCLLGVCDGAGGKTFIGDPSDVPGRSTACPNPRCEGAELLCT